MLYVDDMKIICKDLQQILALKDDIGSEFNINDISLINYYLGIKIIKDCEKQTLTLS